VILAPKKQLRTIEHIVRRQGYVQNVGMKRATLVVFLLALCFLNFYSAYAPDWSRRYFKLPIKSESVRSTVHVMFGSLFLLSIALLLWAVVMAE
jgi:hypothetical protein